MGEASLSFLGGTVSLQILWSLVLTVSLGPLSQCSLSLTFRSYAVNVSPGAGPHDQLFCVCVPVSLSVCVLLLQGGASSVRSERSTYLLYKNKYIECS